MRHLANITNYADGLLKENSLLVKNPKLCEEWNFNKNEFNPENYKFSSHIRVWRICKNNHEWKAEIKSRNNGCGCPYCSGKKATKENNLLIKNPEICKDWNYNKNELSPENYMPNSHEKVWWKCKTNHDWKATIKGRNNGRGCPYCSGRLPTKENNLLIKNPEICKEWDYDKNELSPENYPPSSGKKVWWICKNKHKWETSIANRNCGKSCPYCCGQKVSKDNSLLIKNPKLCEEWNFNKNELGPENYPPNSGKKVWWICKNNHEWKAIIKNRNKGRGCRFCAGKEVTEDNNLLVKNPTLCEEWSKKNTLGPENYTLNTDKKVWWICKKNHEWEATIGHRNSGCGCPHCSKSVSKLSQLWLDELNIKIREFKIPYTKYKVDGYDLKTNTIYEYLGDYWHGNPNVYNPNDLNGKTKVSFFQLYLNTLNRFKRLTKLGYKIVYRWESDTEDKIFNGKII